MFDTKNAAEYFVVAWCKDWSIGQYLRVVGVLADGVDGADDWRKIEAQVTELYPWMPSMARQYANSVRTFVGAAYPKLSAWLFSRASDIDRLKCAPQIERLKPPSKLAKVSDKDRVEMKAATKDARQATDSYRLSRASFQTHQRSAWNVCKA